MWLIGAHFFVHLFKWVKFYVGCWGQFFFISNKFFGGAFPHVQLVDICGGVKSYIRYKNFRPSFGLRPSVTLRGPPLDSETGWTGELWSKTNLLKWQNQQNCIFFQQHQRCLTFFRIKKGIFLQTF